MEETKGKEMERLRRVCGEKNIDFAVKELLIVGEGVFVDVQNNLVVASQEAPLKDIENVIKYIENLTTF